MLVAPGGTRAAGLDDRRVAAVLAAVLAWLAVALFARGVWLPLVVPVLAIVFAFVGDLAWKYFVEGREKRRVKRLFSRYVSKDVYEQLLAEPVAGRARRQRGAR